jgi:putative oxidoreductase
VTKDTALIFAQPEEDCLFAWLNRFQPLGSLELRLLVGAIMISHGYQKVVPSGALHNFIRMVTHMGLPAALGYAAAFTEFFGGMLILVGLLTRVVSLLVIADMAVAILKVHLRNGLSGRGGFEFPLAVLSMALMLFLTGPGYLAIDDLIGRRPAARGKAGAR